jgi:hypothetical protein
MPKFSFSPSDVSNKAARFGLGDDDDDIDDKPARSGRFPLDDADEARKRKGSQPFAGAIAKYSFSLSVVSNKAAMVGLGHDDDDIDERPARSGRFPLDDADEARK